VTRAPSLGTAIAGLGLAYAAFALTFRGPRSRFWQRMTATGALLGAMALAEDPASRPGRLRARDIGLGLLIADGLYAIFQVGDRFARRRLPGGDREIGRIYDLRALRPPEEIGARLALVIGPAEELFWRGLIQRALAARFGRIRGAALAAGAYGGAHVVTGNVTLVGAAATAGLYWSALAALGVPMTALVISHIVWDIWIFLVAPTESGPAGPAGGRA
jgi:membrane protease YdiL (CAAX protease family)